MAYPISGHNGDGMRRCQAFVLLLAFLGGCSTYRPQSSNHVGYQEEELAPRVYRVEFEGGGQIHGKFSVEDYALLRAAELTLEKEYRYFVILGSEADVSGGGGTISNESHHDGGVEKVHNIPGTDTMAAHFHVAPVVFRHVFDVEFFRSRPPGDGQFVYDAAFVQGAARREYGLGHAPVRPGPRMMGRSDCCRRRTQAAGVVRRAFPVWAAISLAGCMTAYGPAPSWMTPYGGYSEMELSPEIYQVRFVPRYNFSSDPPSRLRAFALLRCAELTLETGHRYFIVEGDDVVAHEEHSIDEILSRWKSAEPRTERIKMFSEMPDGENLTVYEAAALRQLVRARYELD